MSCTNIENLLRPTQTELSSQVTLLQKRLLENERSLESLQDSEKRYRRLFESAKDGILILNADTGKVVDVNPFLLNLLCYSYDSVYGKYIWELGVFKDIAASRDAFKVLQDNEYIRYDDLPLVTSDGRPIAVEFVSNVYLVDHCKVIQCNIRDITEKLSLESQFRQAQKMEAVGLLAGGVAHDYNNMLGVILGHAELALSKVDPGHPVHSDLEGILNAAKRSADITQQLMAFARKQTIVPVVLNLNQALENMFTLLKRLIGENINLVWRPEKDLCPIKMDPLQIELILANLCINARDAIAGIGKITIETANAVFDSSFCAQHIGYVPGEYVMLTVSDNGCGMDKKILDQIFEPFFTTKGVGLGTGLGLSTVYGIVKQNHGVINVNSEPGKGSEFRIYLPLCAYPVTDIQREKVAEISPSPSETVLVVEDEPLLLMMVQMMLEKLGYRVLAAGTHVEAFGLAEEHAGEIKLLITDVVMPEMNGRDLAKRLHSLHPGMKTLFMSGYTSDVITDQGVLDEDVNFIQKPFSMKNLAVNVQGALRG